MSKEILEYNSNIVKEMNLSSLLARALLEDNVICKQIGIESSFYQSIERDSYIDLEEI